ncbi:MAG: hypothetical protein ISR53_04470, partial [Rhodospirillales bacterium]|nr:hypothetical protein [Rhodospirillales bacterium]
HAQKRQLNKPKTKNPPPHQSEVGAKISLSMNEKINYILLAEFFNSLRQKRNFLYLIIGRLYLCRHTRGSGFQVRQRMFETAHLQAGFQEDGASFNDGTETICPGVMTGIHGFFGVKRSVPVNEFMCCIVCHDRSPVRGQNLYLMIMRIGLIYR